MNIWPWNRFANQRKGLRDADEIITRLCKLCGHFIEQRHALHNELRDVSVDRDAAQFELAQIKAQRSETTRRGNLTKSAKLKVLRNETHRKLAEEIAAKGYAGTFMQAPSAVQSQSVLGAEIPHDGLLNKLSTLNWGGQ